MSQTAEDIFRQQVVTLLNRSNNDLPTLLKNVARCLNESGRSDVHFDVDSSGTLIKMSQSPYHVNSHMTTFQQTLDALVADAKKKLAGIVPPKETGLTRSVSSLSSPRMASRAATPSRSTASPVNAVPSTGVASTTVEPVSQAVTAPKNPILHTTQSPKKVARQSFRSQSANHTRRRSPDVLPTSKYNGNYILYRYGGSFPKHANYGFYRRYGLEGRGAATSDRHNLPLGVAPDKSTVHRL